MKTFLLALALSVSTAWAQGTVTVAPKATVDSNITLGAACSHSGVIVVRENGQHISCSGGVWKAISSPGGESDGDRDGLADYVLCGDYDVDGDLDEFDIEACIDLVCETGDGGVVELTAGTFTLDVDKDGVGESVCVNANVKNPHVCLPSNCWLRGQGQGITVLQLSDNSLNTCILGLGPSIATDGNYDTEVRSTSGQSTNVRVSDMTIQTNPTFNSGGCETAACDGTPTGFNVGVMLWECDDCIAENIECRELNHACIHLNRTNNSIGRDSFSYHGAGYDTDGAAGGCAPGNQQASFYQYVSTGYESTDSGFDSCEIQGSGGYGFNMRAEGWEERPFPRGADTLGFNTTNEEICQHFVASYGSGLAVTGAILYLSKSGAATGNLTLRVSTISGGNPAAGAVAGCATTDFQTVNVATLPSSPLPLRIDNTDTTPCVLAAATEYALCAAFDNAVAQPDLVFVQYDNSATADTYAPCANCDVQTNSSVGTPAWTTLADKDLNFHIENGRFFRPFVRGGIVNDVTGLGGVGAACMTIRGSTEGDFSLHCNASGGIEIGQAAMSIGGTLHDFSVRNTTATDDSIGAGLWVRPFASGFVIADGRIGAMASGSPCVILGDWTTNVKFDSVHMSSCKGQGGVNAFKGVSHVTFDGGSIQGSEDDGFVFEPRTDVDGVYGGIDYFTIRNMDIVGVENHGFQAENTGTDMRYTRIIGNRFIDNGWNAIRMVADFDNTVIAGNHFRSWGRNAPGSNQTWGVYIDLDFDTMIIDGNIFDSTSTAGEDRGLQLRSDQGGNNVFITDNICLGVFATQCLFLTQNDEADSIVFTGNAGTGLHPSFIEPSFSVLSTGYTCWGEADDPVDEACIGDTGANRVGVPTGDCLTVGGLSWCTGTAVPGTCTQGDIFTDSDGDGGVLCGGGECTLAICRATNTWLYVN